MCKGGRPQNSICEFFLRVTIRNKKYAKCKKCGHQHANSATRMQAHNTKSSTNSASSASIERMFSN